MRKKGIFLKTFRSLITVMLLLTLIIHVFIFFIYKNFYINNCTKEIEADLKYVVDILEKTDDYDAILKAYVNNNPISIGFKTKESIRFYSANNFFLDYDAGTDSMVNVSGLEGTDSILFRTREITLKNGEKATLQLSMNMQQLKQSIRIALSILPYSLLVSTIFALIFSYYYSKKITRPVLDMSAVVRQMTELDKTASILVKDEDEMGMLAKDINVLYGNLLKIIEGYKIKSEEVMHLERERLDFFRGASHELKTPLAKLSVLTENMKYNIGKYKDHEKYLSESLGIINELSEMISEILDGVKNMNVEKQDAEQVFVRASLEKIVEDYRLIAKSKHQKLQLKLSGDLQLKIAVSDLEKVLSNIVSNAIKYGVENGKIEIELNEKELSIYNDALPISEEVMKTIWKGEYVLKRNKDVKSSGLGLYIVKTILERYGIRYSFVPSKDGYLFQMGK